LNSLHEESSLFFAERYSDGTMQIEHFGEIFGKNKKVFA